MEASLRAASKDAPTSTMNIPAAVKRNVDTLVNWKHTSPLTVLLTSLVKKSVNPEQDTRSHKAELPGGYSGRGLDTRVVTPFLASNGFPYMKGGSGWLTRSFEQPHPFDLDYPGRISGVKKEFLGLMDFIEQGTTDPELLIVYLFRRLIQRRDKENVSLSKPTNLTISEIVSCLSRHFEHGGSGKSRLPVLAIYAVYQQMVTGGGAAAAARCRATRTCAFWICSRIPLPILNPGQ